MNIISFPKLNITLRLDPVAFCIGSKPIYWYALIILAGFFLAFLFVYCGCEKRGLKREQLWDIALYGLVFGIIGARLYYVLFALDEFSNIWDMFKIWNGGLAIYGGIIAGILTAAVYCRLHRISVLNTFDVCCGGLFIGQAIGRFGNFVNAEVYGKATSLPWGMSIDGHTAVHPLFLYESLWNILGLILLVLFRNQKKVDGQVFAFYLFWYSFGRFFLEGMRDPEYILYLVPGVIGISQAVALALMAAAIVIFITTGRKAKKAGESSVKAAPENTVE